MEEIGTLKQMLSMMKYKLNWQIPDEQDFRGGGGGLQKNLTKAKIYYHDYDRHADFKHEKSFLFSYTVNSIIEKITTLLLAESSPII